jgi:hypothetical protein
MLKLYLQELFLDPVITIRPSYTPVEMPTLNYVFQLQNGEGSDDINNKIINVIYYNKYTIAIFYWGTLISL